MASSGSRQKARGVHASPLLPSQANHRPPMYNHLKPDAATSSLADFLTDDFIEVVPISAPQVETSVKTVAVLPHLQVAFPEVLTDNASPEVSLDLIVEKPLPTADWYYNPLGHASNSAISNGNISIALCQPSCLQRLAPPTVLASSRHGLCLLLADRVISGSP